MAKTVPRRFVFKDGGETANLFEEDVIVYVIAKAGDFSNQWDAALLCLLPPKLMNDSGRDTKTLSRLKAQLQRPVNREGQTIPIHLLVRPGR
jgi:hypothetical protein